MRAKIRRQKFLFILPLLNRERTYIYRLDISSALYSIKAPFKLVHADVADIRFFPKSAVDPKYCLLAGDFFTSKTYVYPMKRKNFSVEIFSQKDNRLQKMKK